MSSHLSTLWRWHRRAALSAALLNAALLVAAIAVAQRSGGHAVRAQLYYSYPVQGFSRGLKLAMRLQAWLAFGTTAFLVLYVGGAVHTRKCSYTLDNEETSIAASAAHIQDSTLVFLIVVGLLTLALLATLLGGILQWMRWSDRVWRQMSPRSRAWIVLGIASALFLIFALLSAFVTQRAAKRVTRAAKSHYEQAND